MYSTELKLPFFAAQTTKLPFSGPPNTSNEKPLVSMVLTILIHLSHVDVSTFGTVVQELYEIVNGVAK